MQKFYTLILALTIIFTFNSAFSQSILNPADPVVTYNSTNPPNQPTFGQIGKWVRTKRLSYNTDAFKAYIYKGCAFRLLFPKSYNPTANDSKKYPMLVFFHGLGETGNIYDNEYQLYHGGDDFLAAVNNGNYDGYILCMQSQGFWGGNQYQYISEIIDYMIANNKLDAFRVSDNGLSAGGQGTWEMLLNYPTYIAGALPMSNVSIGYKDNSIVNKVKFTPLWLFQGGLDGAPAPNTAQQVRDAMLAAGANFSYKEYPTLGHGVWDSVWLEPAFYPYLLNVYSSNPWPLFGRTEFCPGDAINVTMGLVAGFDQYQWRKGSDSVLGNTTNTLTVTTPGTYYARVRRGSIWSDWSHTPVIIKIKTPTITPPISVAGLMSPVIPAPDGNTSVNLQVPDNGYISYTWKKVGSADTIGKNRILTVTQPGNYIVAVTEKYGCSSVFSAPFSVIDANGKNAPDPATSLTATTLSNTKIELDWSNNPRPNYNETAFEIYRSTASGTSYTYVANMPADTVTYVDSLLTPNVKYYYVVRAINKNGASKISNEASSITQSDQTPPTAPTNLRVASSTNTTVSLAWDSAADNVGVARYDIFVNGVKQYSTTQTSFIVSGLQTLQQFSFYVKAKDISGNYSAQSNQVSAPTALQGLQYNYYTGNWSVLPDFSTLTPVKTGISSNTDITVATQEDQFGFTWKGFIKVPVTGTYKFETYSDDGSKLWVGTTDMTTAPTVNNDGAHAAQYGSGTVTLQAGIYPVAASFFEQSGGQTMQLYWTCSALYGDNNRHYIEDSFFKDNYTATGSAPLAPTNFAASAINYSSAKITWTDNSNNETGFEVYRSSSAAGTYNIIGTVGSNTTSFTDTALSASTTYYYKVVAINGIGSSVSGGLKYSYYEGTWSNLPDFNSLTAIKTGIINNVLLSPANKTTSYGFKFEGNINIATAGQYTFYTKSDDGSKLYIGGFTSSNVVVNNDYLQGPTERSGTITLAKGVYPIFVTFFQNSGDASLTASYQGPNISKQLIPDAVFSSTPASVTTAALPAAPKAPTNVKVTINSSSSLTVQWGDAATNEIGYNVYRSPRDSTHFKLVASLIPNTKTYIDSSLYAHTTYYYKVSAVGVGNIMAFGAVTNAKTKDNNPIINDINSRSVRYGITTTIHFTAYDADGDSLTYGILSKPTFSAFIVNKDNSADLVISPKNTNVGTYSNIKVIVNDLNGGKDTNTFNLTVSDNYDPTIDSIPDYTINENDNTNITLTGHDQNGDALTWTVNNAPNATLTQNPNNIATLNINSTYSSAGTYPVVVNVSDGKGGFASRQFNLTINNKDPNSTIYARFAYQDALGLPWNNINGLTTNNLKDTSGNNTGVSLAIQGNWYVTFNGGPSTGNNSGIYPDAVLKNYYYFGALGGPDSVSVKISGLNKSLKYNLTFYAGTLYAGVADNGNTTYTVGNQTVSLYVQNNTKNTATINNAVPDSTGSIFFKMGKASNAAVGYLNSLIINSVYDDGTNPIIPQLISAQPQTQGIKLLWQDNSYNETRFRIFRASTANGVYTQIDSVVANVTSYVDSNVNGNTQYFYKLQAINNYGNKGFSNIVSVTTGDRIPTITPISNIIIKNNQQLTVSVAASDDATDHVTFSASKLPSFVTFTDNGNGTGKFTIKPSAGTIGYYSGISLKATDNSDSSRTTSFNITVTDNNVAAVYLNFSDGSIAGKPWNNLTGWPFPNTTFNNIVDQDNNASGMQVTLVNGFEGVVASGMRPGNGSTIYPEVVTRTGEFESSTKKDTIRISGLSSTKKYNFVFFNSHDDGLNCLTNFVINGQTVSLNATYNINKTVQINNVTPDANGRVIISISKASGQDYAFISSLIVESYDATSATMLPPANLTVTDAKRNTLSLQWADRSYNETGFQIWRADETNSTYTKIATVGSNVTTYTDANLTADKAYYYVVKAANATSTSDYSNVAVGHTLSYAVYVNFTASNTANSPWNNLAAPPQVGYVWNNFIDEKGYLSSLGMTELSAFAGMYGDGVSTFNNSGIYPDTVMIESYGLFQGQTGVMKLSGLNVGMKYNLTFFASSKAYGDVNVGYTVNGKTVLLNTSLNSKGNITMYDVVPDENGEVVISIAAGTPTSQFGLIGALIVQGYHPGTVSVPSAPGATQNLIVSSQNSSTAQKVAAEQNKDIKINAYPNPFINKFNLTVNLHQQDDVMVEVYNIAGKLIFTKEFKNLSPGETTLNMQPNSIPAGLYVVKVVFAQQKTTKIVKLLKQ